MPIFDTLIPASFTGIKFPVRSVSVHGGLRDHVHEFPHSPGGQPEKLGRKLYEIHVVALFHTTFRKYPNLWPDGINRLLTAFESGTTGDLGVPTLGTIKAYCFDWSKDSEAKARSGETAEFTFREDASDLNLQTGDPIASVDALEAQFQGFEALISTSFASKESHPSAALTNDRALQGNLLDSLTDAVNSVTAIKDQIETAGDLVAAKIDRVAGLCRQLDSTVKFFDNPVNHHVKDALHNLWFSSVALSNDVSRHAIKNRRYTVLVSTSIGGIAKTLFGDSARAVEILQLNRDQINDPFLIPAGTVLTVPAI